MATEQNYAICKASLDTLRRHIGEQTELMLGIVENGPWVLIPHPSLRALVGRYVADAVAELAAVVGADDAEVAARELRGDGPLPTTF